MPNNWQLVISDLRATHFGPSFTSYSVNGDCNSGIGRLHQRRRCVCLRSLSTHQDYIESITMALLRCTGSQCRNGTRWSPPCARSAAANSCWCLLFRARPSTRRRDAVCSPFQRSPLTNTRIFCEKNIQPMSTYALFYYI